jgi:asparagine synthase (glutamine-hydrolysing)
MCGIAGIAGQPAPDHDTLVRMAQAMTHRGPDDQGVWSDDRVGLAFRRLAIIDLEERSNQPLHHQGLHMTFNGEIYNYRELRAELEGRGHGFVTEGDGEVLLHAWCEWHEAALDRINGMFALAIWDEREGSLTLASDPFGEKPLYYSEHRRRLAFASDIRALAAGFEGIGAADERAIEAFVARNLMPAPEGSFFTGVKRLPAAHLLRWQAGRTTVRCYWTPRIVDVPDRYEDAADELRELLLDSVRLRLRSDVPVGTSLSGGIDSSAVVGLCAQLGSDARRHAFTATFPGYERDEWGYASQVASAAGVVEHHRVAPTSPELADDVEALVRGQEEPFGSTSIYAQWRVNQKAHQVGVVVLLDGQGADELFGGYPWMVGTAAVAGGPAAIAGELRAGGGRRSGVLRALAGTYLPQSLARVHQRRAASPYASQNAVSHALTFSPPTPSFATGLAMRQELVRQSFVTSLPTLLRYADRNSMAHSREVRLPFLDRRVAEFALSLPPSFLCRDGVTKRILRDAVRDLVPQSVLARRDKVAFEPPQARWLSEPRWLERIGGVLLDPTARARDLYDHRAIEADLRGGSWRDHHAVWRAYCAEVWRHASAASGRAQARLPASQVR